MEAIIDENISKINLFFNGWIVWLMVLLSLLSQSKFCDYTKALHEVMIAS
jgi:hypothetical protein